MRFMPVKEEHQQAMLTLHRTRQGFIEERTALYNRLRGLIAEFGTSSSRKSPNACAARSAPISKTCPAMPTAAWATCLCTPTG